MIHASAKRTTGIDPVVGEAKAMKLGEKKSGEVGGQLFYTGGRFQIGHECDQTFFKNERLMNSRYSRRDPWFAKPGEPLEMSTHQAWCKQCRTLSSSLGRIESFLCRLPFYI